MAKFKCYNVLYVDDKYTKRKRHRMYSCLGLTVHDLNAGFPGNHNMLNTYLKLTEEYSLTVTPFRMCHPVTGELITLDSCDYELTKGEAKCLDYFGTIPIITSFEYLLLCKYSKSLASLDRLTLTTLDQKLRTFYATIQTLKS